MNLGFVTSQPISMAPSTSADMKRKPSIAGNEDVRASRRRVEESEPEDGLDDEIDTGCARAMSADERTCRQVMYELLSGENVETDHAFSMLGAIHDMMEFCEEGERVYHIEEDGGLMGFMHLKFEGAEETDLHIAAAGLLPLKRDNLCRLLDAADKAFQSRADCLAATQRISFAANVPGFFSSTGLLPTLTSGTATLQRALQLLSRRGWVPEYAEGHTAESVEARGQRECMDVYSRFVKQRGARDHGCRGGE